MSFEFGAGEFRRYQYFVHIGFLSSLLFLYGVHLKQTELGFIRLPQWCAVIQSFEAALKASSAIRNIEI